MGVARFPQARTAFALVAAAAVAFLFAYMPARADYADGVFAQNHITLESAVRVWRKAAWQNNDFLAEVKLGDVYNNSSDNRFYDPVEAYVWYYLAGRDVQAQNWDDATGNILNERTKRAQWAQGQLLQQLSTDERHAAHDRIVYILACRGANGFLDLGRATMADTSRYRGDRGYRQNNSVMETNNTDALVYFHIADSLGNPLGRGYLNQLEGALKYDRSGGTRVVEKAAKLFHYWAPPYEFYPAGESPGGVPHSDECQPTLEKQGALVKAVAIPAPDVRHALSFLGWNGPGAISNYQASLPDEVTGKLTGAQIVRAIQSAAVNGDAQSQNTLGVMYANGLGVVTNYARAEYWFTKAADQRYPAALYYLAILYKAGPPGVDQDLHKSNDYMTNSALAGFRPTINQLSALLSRAANAPPRPGQN
jgi:TPR repeat protein